jgi:HD-GYP domain-containing protein (c-di-GMP phosphodiesterase class II)
MKCVNIESVEPGQFLGKTIFSSNGAILLSEDVQLTVFMITTLRRIGVTMVYIKDPNFEDVEIAEVVSNETKMLVMRKMGETFDSIRSGKDLSTRAFSISIDSLLDEITRNKEMLIQLTDIRTQDNEMYVHALNVCMMSVILGLNIGFSPVQLKELAIGALLHDVGKLELIRDDDAKDVKLHHTWRGFELLKNKREYSLLIAHVAFQHHETIDGLGVPRQLNEEQIHLYARIVAVTNTYDNLLFNLKEDGSRMLPHEACEHMMALAGVKLDREIVVQFLKSVSVYHTGASVHLSTKETGVVVGQHRGLPGRPIVRVVKQDTDSNNLEIKEIDLAKHTTVFIDNVIS